MWLEIHLHPTQSSFHGQYRWLEMKYNPTISLGQHSNSVHKQFYYSLHFVKLEHIIHKQATMNCKTHLDHKTFSKMTVKQLKSFLRENYPEVPFGATAKKNELIDLAINSHYPKHILNGVNVLDDYEYVKLPFLDLKELDYLCYDIGELKYSVIFNEGTPEEEKIKKGPKRYQSDPLIIGTRQCNPILFAIKKRLDDLAGKFNPLLKVDEIRFMKSEPFVERQMVHADNTEIDTGDDNNPMENTLVLSAIIPLSGNSVFYISFREKLRKVIIHRGEILLFKSEHAHCGAENNQPIDNLRIHVTFHDMKNKLKENQIHLRFQCCHCHAYVKTKIQLKYHQIDCRENTSEVSLRRKKKKKQHYHEKKKKKSDTTSARTIENDSSLENDTAVLGKEERVIVRINNEIKSNELTQSGDTEETYEQCSKNMGNL